MRRANGVWRERPVAERRAPRRSGASAAPRRAHSPSAGPRAQTCGANATLAPRARVPLLLALAAAASIGSGAACTGAESTPTGAEDTVVVFAAASLRDAFTRMGEAFGRDHPGVRVSFNFAGTQELRTQLEHGAPADVFASADPHHMAELVRSSRVGTPIRFARNEPVIVVARESAAAVDSLADLPNLERIVLATPEVPGGRYALRILDRARASLGSDFPARVEAKLVSRELNVRQVLAKVSLGEAQAGIVYRSDVRSAADGVEVVSIPPDINVVAEYPIAVVSGAAHPERARAWVAFVHSPKGQRALTDAGFVAAEDGSSS